MRMVGQTVIFPDLSYRINGILFATHNELGRFCNERQYCDRIEEWLKKQEIPYQREVTLPPSFPGEKPSRNRVDFYIDEKIILEVKAKRVLGREDYYQSRRYQTAIGCKLTILVNLQRKYLQIKRIVNPSVSS